MTHGMKHRLAAFGMALGFLLFTGCQAGGTVLVLPDGTGTAPGTGTEWQTLLLDAMNKQQEGSDVFQRGDDKLAEQMLGCVKKISGDDAAAAKGKLAENPDDRCANGAIEMRNELKLEKEDKTRLVGYATVPQEQSGSAELWDVKDIARKINKSSCLISSNAEQAAADHVGFAMGKIGEEIFIIAVFQ